METRANYVLIGAFVLGGAIALMLFVVWISRAPFNRDFNTYDVVFEGAVNGLSEGGEVRFNGIKVGEVKQLSLDPADPKKVIARVRVAATTPVRTDSVAQLDFLGITGVTFIQIRPGSADKPLLKGPANNPPIMPTERTALDELLTGGQDVLTISTESLNKINNLLSDENIASLSGTLHNIEVLTGKIADDGGMADNATSALASIDRAARQVEAAAASVDMAVKDIDGLAVDLRPAVAEVGPALADARAAISSLAVVASDLRTRIAPNAAATLDEVSLAASDLRALMLRIQSLAAEIEQDPSRFVVTTPRPVE